MVSINQVKQLRQETGISITECKKALEESRGDFDKAKKVLRRWGKEFVKGKSGRETQSGVIESYIHPDKRIGVLLELDCETDFVAKSEDFKKLAHELCLQIAAMNPEETSLMSQSWVKDETKTINDMLQGYISRIGENIVVKRFMRYEI